MVYLVALADRASLERAANNRAAGCLVRPLTDRQLVSEALLATITAARRPATRAELPSAMTPDEKLRLIAAVVGDLPLADPLDASRDSRAEPGNGGDPQSSLSARERQIVELLANGARVVTIAQRLQLSPHTVRNHLKSVFRKLNLHGQHELFEYWNAHAS
jgi:DNA-binding CsgD family transcriptional regulator